MTKTAIASLVDLSRYPIDCLDGSDGQAFLATSRKGLEQDGALVLGGFLRPEAIDMILEEVKPLLSLSYCRPHRANVYLSASDPAFSDEHARNRTNVTNLSVVAYDQIPKGSALRALYNWEPLREFIAGLVGYPQLYPYEDPLGSLNINIMQDGQELGWHFDDSDFATTLLLQTPYDGGTFEYLPAARSDDDSGYDKVSSALDGDPTGIRELSQDPGSLVLFRGRYALHRVTATRGERPRIVAVLVYDTKPGVHLTEYNRNLLYGRVS